MKKKINKDGYTNPGREINMALLKGKVIEDFLPSLEELMERDKMKRVRIMLNNNSLNFLKNYAKQHNASYQAMIRNLVDSYASKLHASN